MLNPLVVTFFSPVILSNIHCCFNIFHEFKVPKVIITEIFNVDFHNKFIKFWIILIFSFSLNDIYIYIYIYHHHHYVYTIIIIIMMYIPSSSSLCIYHHHHHHQGMQTAQIPFDSLSPFVSIGHCTRQEQHPMSATEVMNANFCWLANSGVSIAKSPWDDITNEFVLTSLAEPNISCLFYLNGLWDGR